MKRVAQWALAVGGAGLLSFACAQVEGDPSEGGSGGSASGGAQSGSGGRSTGSGSGGRSSAASGGAENMGGTSSGGASAACVEGSEASCSDHTLEAPRGTAICTDGAWDLSGCTFCTPDEEVACGAIYQLTPMGTLNCDEQGLGWLVDPLDACLPCEFGTDMGDCDSTSNPTNSRGGEATCTQAGSFDWSECTICDDEVEPPTCSEQTAGDLPYGVVSCEDDSAWSTDACTECDPLDYEATFDCLDLVSPIEDFTGGLAYCGLDGSWDQSTCEFCGDGLVTGPEDCDPAAASMATTCGELSASFVNPDEEAGCNAICGWSTSTCTMCPGANCLSGGTCVGASCDEKECEGSNCRFDCQNGNACTDVACGVDSVCDFICQNGGGGCENASCKSGSTCEFNCSNGGQCENIECTGATCSIICENPQSVCSTAAPLVCRDGENCTVNCKNGGDCTGVEMICESGSTCEVNCENNGAKCATATCEAGATCSVNCSNSSCPTLTGF